MSDLFLTVLQVNCHAKLGESLDFSPIILIDAN